MITTEPGFLDFIEGVEAVDALEPRPAFEVTNYESAQWCMVKAQGAERRMQQRRGFVAAYKDKLDKWEAEANAADIRTTERMAELLQPWVEKELVGQKRQSVSLPTGTVGFRQSPDSIEVVNLVAAVLHLKELGAEDCIRIREEVDKRTLMARVKAGEPLPEGCELHEGGRRFYVKVSE